MHFLRNLRKIPDSRNALLFTNNSDFEIRVYFFVRYKLKTVA